MEVCIHSFHCKSFQISKKINVIHLSTWYCLEQGVYPNHFTLSGKKEYLYLWMNLFLLSAPFGPRGTGGGVTCTPTTHQTCNASLLVQKIKHYYCYRPLSILYLLSLSYWSRDHTVTILQRPSTTRRSRVGRGMVDILVVYCHVWSSVVAWFVVYLSPVASEFSGNCRRPKFLSSIVVDHLLCSCS